MHVQATNQVRSVGASSDEAVHLPAPVERYFEFALPVDRRHLRGGRVTHRGEFQSRPGEWNAFTSVEYVSVRPPGFVWDANIRMAPLLSVHVRDSYLNGAGAMRATAVAVLTVMDRHGSSQLSQAALQRWLGEAAWTPTALLPSADLRWDAIDDRSARATIADQGITASLTFEFDSRGAIVRCHGDRYRDTNGVPVLTPWEGTFDTYASVDGITIPLRGEAAWLIDGERAPYWCGHITSVDYDFG
jgi:hypothetical protein